MRRERHLNVSVLGIRVSLIKTELPGYTFIQSAIREEKKSFEVSEKCLALVSSLRGGLFGGWMQGQANKAEERMKKRNSWFVTSCDIKSKSISASRFGDDFYPQILANTVNSTCSKHYNFTWQQFLCCVLLPELCKRVCVWERVRAYVCLLNAACISGPD